MGWLYWVGPTRALAWRQPQDSATNATPAPNTEAPRGFDTSQSTVGPVASVNQRRVPSPRREIKGTAVLVDAGFGSEPELRLRDLRGKTVVVTGRCSTLCDLHRQLPPAAELGAVAMFVSSDAPDNLIRPTRSSRNDQANNPMPTFQLGAQDLARFRQAAHNGGTASWSLNAYHLQGGALCVAAADRALAGGRSAIRHDCPLRDRPPNRPAPIGLINARRRMRRCRIAHAISNWQHASLTQASPADARRFPAHA